MKKRKPLVSIIVNCYNGSEFLREALRSLKMQTYKNFEVIFWDNRSTDDSKKIFNSLKDKRFRYFLANKRTPLYCARNLAIKKSKGQFISFLDADDLWLPKKLSLQIPLFKNPEVGVVYSKLLIYNNSTKKKKIHVNRNLAEGKIFDKIINNYNVGIITTVIRRKYFLELKKKFDQRYTHIGDFDLFLRLSKICEFRAIQEPAAIYRAHGKKLTTIDRFGSIKEFENWLKENRKNLNTTQLNGIESLINYKKFIFYKLNDKFLNALKIFFIGKSFSISIKKILILLIPSKILKKIFWY